MFYKLYMGFFFSYIEYAQLIIYMWFCFVCCHHFDNTKITCTRNKMLFI